jgi:hypothetical protein
MEETALPMSNPAVSGAGLVQVNPAVAAAEAAISKTVETAGLTKLVETAGNFFLDGMSSGTGPELKYNGAAFYASEIPNGWTPVAAEQISGGGYEVAGQIPNSEQFTIWATDANGNYVSTIAAGSGTSPGIEQAESVLHQDLNSDGVIGTSTVAVVADKSVSTAALGPATHHSFKFAAMPYGKTIGGTRDASTIEHIPDFAARLAATVNDNHSSRGQSAFEWSSTNHTAEFDNHHDLTAPNIHYAELTHAYLIH